MKKLTKKQIEKYNLFLAEETADSLSYFTTDEAYELLITDDEFTIIVEDGSFASFSTADEALRHIEILALLKTAWN